MYVYNITVGIVWAVCSSGSICQLLYDYANPTLYLSLLHQSRELDRCQGKGNKGQKGQSSK